MATERRQRLSIYVGPKGDVSPDELDALEATKAWVADIKKDGFWACAVVDGGVIVQMVSRTGLDFSGGEAQGLIGLKVFPSGSGRLVGELTADADASGERIGVRRLHVFDVLDWNGLDLRDLVQIERREALEMIYAAVIHRDLVRLVEQRQSGFRAWFDEVVASGGEGLVLKRKDATCRPTNADGKIDTWAKCKPYRSVDYIVVSVGKAAKGTPNVDLGLYKNGRVVKVLTCTLPPEWRKLSPERLVGYVVEAEGREIWPSGALRHAQLGHRSGPRTDKSPEECTIEAALGKAPRQ